MSRRGEPLPFDCLRVPLSPIIVQTTTSTASYIPYTLYVVHLDSQSACLLGTTLTRGGAAKGKHVHALTPLTEHLPLFCTKHTIRAGMNGSTHGCMMVTWAYMYLYTVPPKSLLHWLPRTSHHITSKARQENRSQPHQSSHTVCTVQTDGSMRCPEINTADDDDANDVAS